MFLNNGKILFYTMIHSVGHIDKTCCFCTGYIDVNRPTLAKNFRENDVIALAHYKIMKTLLKIMPLVDVDSAGF